MAQLDSLRDPAISDASVGSFDRMVAAACLTSGWRARITITARLPLSAWAMMQSRALSADPGESVGERATDGDDGLAKLVELVSQYAAPMYAPTAAGADAARWVHASQKITSSSQSDGCALRPLARPNP